MEAPPATGGVAWARLGRKVAGLSAWKREHQMLAVGYALGMEGFATKEEDSRWSLYEPSREMQRKKERKDERRL